MCVAEAAESVPMYACGCGFRARPVQGVRGLTPCLISVSYACNIISFW